MDASASDGSSGSSKRRKTIQGFVASVDRMENADLKRKNSMARARAEVNRKHAAAMKETKKNIDLELESAIERARKEHERAVNDARQHAMLKHKEIEDKARKELEAAQAEAEAECNQKAEAELKEASTEFQALFKELLSGNEEMKRALMNILTANAPANAQEAATATVATQEAPVATQEAPVANTDVSEAANDQQESSATAPEPATVATQEAANDQQESSATAPEPPEAANDHQESSATAPEPAYESSTTADKASGIIEDLIEAVSQCGDQKNHVDMLRNIEKYHVLDEEMFQDYRSSFPKVPEDEDDEEMKYCYVNDDNGGLLLVAMVVCAMKKQGVTSVDFFYTIPGDGQFPKSHNFFRMQLDGYDDQEPSMKISFTTITSGVKRRLQGKKRTARQQKKDAAADAKAEREARNNTKEECAGLDDFVEEYLKKIFDEQMVHHHHKHISL